MLQDELTMDEFSDDSQESSQNNEEFDGEEINSHLLDQDHQNLDIRVIVINSPEDAYIANGPMHPAQPLPWITDQEEF